MALLELFPFGSAIAMKMILSGCRHGPISL
jgi:hypothetical protein